MKSKQLHKSLLMGFLAIALLFGLLGNLSDSVSAAASSGELKNQLEELESQKEAVAQQIADLQSRLSQNLNEISDMVNQKNLIDQEIALLYQQVATINDQIATYRLLIADKQVELEKAQANHAQRLEQNKERIRAMEKNGRLSYWSVLFKANSFIDLLDRLKMIRQIANADKERLEELRLAAEAVTEAKTALETEAAAMEEVRAELADTQLGLEEKCAEAEGLLNQLRAEGEEFELLLEMSEQNQTDLMEEIAQKEAEYDNAKYQEWLETSVPETTEPPTTEPPTTEPPATEPPETVPPTTEEDDPDNSGDGSDDNNSSSGNSEWLMPMQYTRLTSPFGYRYHPITGDWRMHYGVDLSAPTGTPIYASRSGEVTVADYQEGGAGNYVSINHGDGYASIYMHMTHYVVAVGEQVTAGQLIGYCGATGGATGPHLHFGISYRGTYVNPADYIQI